MSKQNADSFLARLLVSIHAEHSQRINLSFDPVISLLQRQMWAERWAYALTMEERESHDWSHRCGNIEKLNSLDVERLKSDIIVRHYEHLAQSGFGKKQEELDIEARWSAEEAEKEKKFSANRHKKS